MTLATAFIKPEGISIEVDLNILYTEIKRNKCDDLLYRQKAMNVSIYHRQRANNQIEEPQILRKSL